MSDSPGAAVQGLALHPSASQGNLQRQRQCSSEHNNGLADNTGCPESKHDTLGFLAGTGIIPQASNKYSCLLARMPLTYVHAGNQCSTLIYLISFHLIPCSEWVFEFFYFSLFQTFPLSVSPPHLIMMLMETCVSQAVSSSPAVAAGHPNRA